MNCQRCGGLRIPDDEGDFTCVQCGYLGPTRAPTPADERDATARQPVFNFDISDLARRKLAKL